MVIDASAIIAILLDESDATAISTQIEAESNCRMSAVSYLEASMVLWSRKGDGGLIALEKLIAGASVYIEDFSTTHARIALNAFQQYGKGHHPARLNFGDCATYALARMYGEPILCKGNDFRQTDIACLP